MGTSKTTGQCVRQNYCNVSGAGTSYSAHVSLSYSNLNKDILVPEVVLKPYKNWSSGPSS